MHRVRYTDGREEWSDLVACGRFLSDGADGDALVSTPIMHEPLFATHQYTCEQRLRKAIDRTLTPGLVDQSILRYTVRPIRRSGVHN